MSRSQVMVVNKENFVMFPFMAQGHIIPFLALALEIEKKSKNCTITFVNTPLNIEKLGPSIPGNSCIRLVEIPFDSTEFGFPPNTENLDSLIIPPLRSRFIRESPCLRPAFEKFISCLVREIDGAPLCIISDVFFGWSAKIAHQYGAFHTLFNVGGDYGVAVLNALWIHLPHLKTDSMDFPIPGFPPGYRLHRKHLTEQLKVAEIGCPFQIFWQQMAEDCKETDGVLFNTVEEIGTAGLDYFRKENNCPVWPVGPLLFSLGSKAKSDLEAQETLRSCIEWLDSKPKNSVLYIAFGSMSALTSSQMTQMALALESSSINFIWVVRSPSNSKIGEGLLENFEQRMKKNGQGLVLRKWAPQLEILSHKATAAFLTHSGWNSVIEALNKGLPMLTWPMGAEHPFISKIFEEKFGVCVQVGNASDEIGYEEIKEKIELVMGETEKSKEMKRKASEIKEMFIKAKMEYNGYRGSSVKNMDEFLEAAFQSTCSIDIKAKQFAKPELSL